MNLEDAPYREPAGEATKAAKIFQIQTKQMTRLLLPLHLSLDTPQAPLTCIFQTLLRKNGCSSIAPVLRDRLGVSSNRNSLYGLRTFCTGGDLAAKKCVPCNSKDMRAMTEESANDLVSKVNGWNLVKEDGMLKLRRAWTVKSFTKGLEFFQLVGNVAEAEGHHPDLHLVGWNNVKIEIWTHAIGGLTENDFILAAKINKLQLHDLLRKKSTT